MGLRRGAAFGVLASADAADVGRHRARRRCRDASTRPAHGAPSLAGARWHGQHVLAVAGDRARRIRFLAAQRGQNLAARHAEMSRRHVSARGELLVVKEKEGSTYKGWVE